MPLDLGYVSSESDLSRSASLLRPTVNSPEIKRVSIPLNGLDKRENRPAADLETYIHSNGSPDLKKNAFEALSVKGSSRLRDENGSAGGMNIAGTSSVRREEIDLTISPKDDAVRNGSRQRSPNTSDKGSSRRTVKNRILGSSPSEEGALRTPRPIRRDGLDRESSPRRHNSGSGHDDASSSTKRDRRRSRGELASTPERIGKDRASPRRDSKKRSRQSDDESDSQTRPVIKGSRALARSPSREVTRNGASSKMESSSRDLAEKSSDRPEQRTSHRLPEDDRERDYHRSSRSKRHDDGLDYETGGASHGSDAYGRYAKDDRRSRPEYDDHRSRGRDRYDDRDYRSDRYRHDRYRDEERSSYRRGDYDSSYRAGGRRDPDDDRGDRYRGDDHYRHRDMRDDRDRDHDRDRGKERADDRHPRSPLIRSADEPRPRSPIAWTHAPQRGQVLKPPSPRRDLEPPAPPPILPDLPPPPPSPPGLKRKSPPTEIVGDEGYRVNKRPKLSRQEPSASIVPAPPPELPQEVPPPPLLEAGAVTPDPQLAEPQIDTRVPTPVPDQPVRNHDQDEIFRQERKQKRDLFPDRSRIGLGQGKRLDLLREAKIYGKSFAGLGRLEGYKVSKTGDGALGRGTFGTVTKATRISDGVLVALKLLQNPQQTQLKSGEPRKDGMLTTTAREIKNLKMLNHENIVPLLEMVVERKAGESEANIFLVFPYMEHDLCGYIHSTESMLTVQNLKVFAAQMLDGLAEMHRNKIVHRDLKTANILINNRGLLQIADFGLSRALSSDKPSFTSDDAHYTNMVVTRWYRAPELLVGETMYGPAVDMWSIGCILAEMFTGKVFIMGKSNSHQLLRIFNLVGPPKSGAWERFDSVLQYNDVHEDEPSLVRKTITVQEITGHAMNTYHSHGNTDASSWNPFKAERELEALIRSLLELDPAKRPSALDARSNQFFLSSLGYSRDMIAPLKQDSRESGSMARNAMSKQMRDDISVDPFHSGMPTQPVYPNAAGNAASYHAMANNMQAVNAAANMFANQAGVMHGMGVGNPGMMPRPNMLHNPGMTAAPVVQMPGANRFNNNMSNHSTPNRAPQMSFNPSRGPPQPGLGNGLPYGGNMGQQGQYQTGPQGRPGGPPGYAQPNFMPNLPRPSFAAPVRPMPGPRMLPSRPGMTNGAVHQAPLASMPGQRPR